MARAMQSFHRMHGMQAAESGNGLLGGSLDDGRITFDPPARERGEKRDPVCGKSLPANSGFSQVHKGVEYRFCCRACQAKFVAEPERYAG